MDDAKAAHTRYLHNVTHFLKCAANRHLIPSLPPYDQETVCACTRDVVAELTRTLLGLFAADKVRTTLESKHLDSVIWKLAVFDDMRMERCIPDDLVLDISHLADMLKVHSDYVDSYYVRQIHRHAATLKRSLIRVKHKPGTTSVPVRCLYSQLLMPVHGPLGPLT